MTKEELILGVGNEDAQAEILSGYEVAKRAVENGDAKALFALYEKASLERGHALKCIEILCEYGTAGRKGGQSPVDENSVAALKEVALEALALAKLLAGRGAK